MPTVPVGHRIGQVDVARLQTARDRFKAVDNEFGGVTALPSITTYVRNEVRPLLRGSYSDLTGHALRSTAAQLILDAGWAAYDANLQSFARRCMHCGLPKWT